MKKKGEQDESRQNEETQHKARAGDVDGTFGFASWEDR